ncbi:Dyp-type peroxidase family [Blastococcus colisei]|uniref:Dyp-type peroxidase family n=1 Tax=Blastococcus colisei TaxID=1564162 RepID=A0A543PFM7_9ACTN|nr:peroxidase [Blastococcus colisei]TQN42885.1 Dyp-type peroxidase family [Blastococcus colisei]
MVSALDLADVQGLIVRGYTMPLARHVLLRIDVPAVAHRLLASLVDGGPSTPQVTSGAPWETKPEHCLNVGITFAGLQALGVSQRSLASFPDEFIAGAAARAERVGDVGTSAPANWLPAFTDPGLHLLVSVFARDGAALNRPTDAVVSASGRGLTELCRFDAALLGARVDHFGYVDGISQPTIASAPPTGPPDAMPVAPTGEFLLGHPSQHVGFSYPVPTPDALGRNGSFAAFRMLAQDVDAFTELLTEHSRRTGLSTELIAAKLCGRWRNGTPLVLSPHADTPQPPLSPEQLNDFDYVGRFADERGMACPIGAHVRRMYPRGSRVAGNGGHKHRIVRRGLTYGPAFDPARPHDGVERGLLGMFIGVSLRDQFEFLMADWANDGLFAPGLGRSKDPIVGANDDAAGTFSIPGPGGATVLTDLPRLVTTRGGAYFFLPSLTALRYLTDLSGAAESQHH